MSKIDVSVIIPTFNRFEFLNVTLQNLINQKVQNIVYEIVIVDSGSDITESYITYLKRMNKNINIQYVKIEGNKNRSLLRNLGSDIALGELLIFLDNDMIVSPEFISSHNKSHICNEDKLVLGKRKSLTDFSKNKITPFLLCNCFDLLDSLPCFEDDRDQYLINKGLSIDNAEDPWRFVFSHSFSIRKKTFNSIGKFDKEFGNNWGYEDLEFGYRCYINKVKIEMLEAPYSYHQPHFEQSKEDQKHALPNMRLCVKKHNTYFMELFVLLYNEYLELKKNVENVDTKVQVQTSTLEMKKFELVLGCIERKNSNKCFLGVCVPFDKKVNKVLILETFFHFCRKIQICILREAIRVGKTIFVRKVNQDDYLTLLSLFDIIGFEVSINTIDLYYVIRIEKLIQPKIFSIILPPVYLSEKRLVYKHLVKNLQDSGNIVIIKDIYDVRDFRKEDYDLEDDENMKLAKCIRSNYGMSISKDLYSLNMHLSNSFLIPDSRYSVVINDFDYKYISDNTQIQDLPQSKHFDKQIFENITFNTAIFYVRKYISQMKNTNQQKGKICCFMNYGYYEDGIDRILEAFSSIVRKDPSVRLVIKLPDYKELALCTYPLHNNASREAKNFSFRTKVKNDLNLLNNSISNFGIENSVTVIQKNYSIIEYYKSFKNHQCSFALQE
ncbi:MAG TPA: glycosyltransferase [Treponemataceae bacterium]|nr:glycosyltransferase [Treponemataceae bacterium]